MPLSKLQTDILRLLAAHRALDSHVAGATALNQDGPRFSEDIDVFHDREEAVAKSAQADVALLASSGFSVQWLRREPRDVLDLLLIHERHLPLGATIWAAVAKDPGYSPESLITEIRRNAARYRADDYTELALAEPVDAGAMARHLRAALEDAERFVGAMQAGKEGLLFLKQGKPIQPPPDDLASVVEHTGQRRGLWPSSPDIGSAMLEDE